MSHALLLRLFLSPYFSISVAIYYLKTYPESIGISHYLCWRMRQMKAEDVEFYWPQICHLLITRPTESNALECFVLDRAEESTHSAMLTFWFMQAALRDLTPTRSTNPRSFAICQKVLHRCHEIIFGDPPDPSSSPYKSLPASPRLSANRQLAGGASAGGGNGLIRRTSVLGKKLMGAGQSGRGKGPRVNPHLGAALVGMGVVLASTPGMPDLADMTGQVAIMQGRRVTDERDAVRQRIEIARDEGADGPRGGEDAIARINSHSGNRSGGASLSDDSDVEGSPRKGSFSEAGNGSLRKGMSKGMSIGQAGRRDRKGHLEAESAGQDEKGSVRLDSPPRDSYLKRQGNPGAKPPNNLSTRPIHPSHTSPSLIQSPAAFQSSIHLPSPLKAHPIPGSQPRQSLPGGNALQGMTAMPEPPSRPRSTHPIENGQPAPFQSTPVFSQPNSKNPLRMHMPSSDALLSMYDLDAQRQLLRSHYCRSEFRFLSALEDISNRLLVIPKPARLSALRAELTGLNHSLPAEVCMPLWCPADHGHEDGGETRNGHALQGREDKPTAERSRAHHRVVRISPGDSVVLNSAEKAPYLLHLEILEDDLDFDPSRRGNRELLKKIVVQEELKKRKKEGIETIEPSPLRGKLDGLGWPVPDAVGTSGEKSDRGGHGRRPSSPRRSSGPTSPIRKASTSSAQKEPEEVDLIEQLFGADYSLKDRKVDLTESLPVPVGPQNKTLDAVTWSRRDGPPLLSRNASSFASRNGSPLPSPKLISSPTFSDYGVRASPDPAKSISSRPVITLEDYSERMRTAAVMLAQLNASMVPEKPGKAGAADAGVIPGRGAVHGSSMGTDSIVDGSVVHTPTTQTGSRMRLDPVQAVAIRDRIMDEMMSLEEERVSRMTAQPEGYTVQPSRSDGKTAEDESIIRRELNKADPSAAIFSESWAAKKSRIQAASPWGHLARWNVLSVIVKTGADLRQEQLATQLIERFGQIWKEEKCDCWVRFFRILITGDTSGLVETITDAISVHSIKKAQYARRIAEGALGSVSLMDHYVQTYGDPSSGRFAKAQRNFIKSLAAYSVISFLLQLKDRHNGNILVDREGHLIHIDFGFMLSNSPGNMGFEAAPFKLPMDYVEIMGGLDSPGFQHFKKLFKEGFEAARKHSDSIITMVELMQKNSKLDCFQMFGEQTSMHLRERFQLGLTTQAVDAYMERLIVTSIGSSWTRLYDSFQYYSQGVL